MLDRTSVGADFLLGVNYWPCKSAMAMWSRFDRGEIDEDLSRIRALGLRVVRFFLLWEDFQPSPSSIDSAILEKLSWFVDRIAHHGLLAMPTFFTGHMSGVNWLPPWTLDTSTTSDRFRTVSGGRTLPYGIADFYTGKMLQAQRLLARTVGARFRNHPAIYMWDLGNEFSNLRAPASPDDAANWSKRLTEDLFETSGLPVTGGTHGEDITFDRNLRLSTLCAPWALATMHGYTVYSSFARDRLDPETVPFLAELARSFSAKPLLFSEFGNPSCPTDNFAYLTDDEMATYAQAVLERLHARGALGAFWWCWTDYDPALRTQAPFDQAPHEMQFGITRHDGSEKPVAAVLKSFAEKQPKVQAASSAMFSEQAYYFTLPASVDECYKRYVERYS